MRRRRAAPRRAALASGVALSVVACASGTPVQVEDATLISGPLMPDGHAGFPDAVPDASPSAPPVEVPAPPSDIRWVDCAPYDIPERVVERSAAWECATLAVPMNPFDETVRLPDIELALTRHAATGVRQGALLVNPGGPGASGLATAWSVRSGMPTEILRAFDIVSWDPRGVGRSSPPITCGDADPEDDDFIERCADLTGPMSAHLSAPNSVADMEAIRVALGESELNYLGFSYGSILGAGYAAVHPETVGAFVLDGVTDPRAGSDKGPFEAGFPVFAADGRPAALERFSELCDATEHCLPGRVAEDVLDDLPEIIGSFDTADFDGEPAVVDSDGFDELIDAGLAFAGNWELLATALDDADGGDASAAAALLAGNDDVDPERGDDEAGEADAPSPLSAFVQANFLIYCADFGPLITRWSFCDGIPENNAALTPVRAVDIDTPMLLIGTEYDPLTPGRHAPEFVAAIEDAVHMVWEGVGHTAFPGWTDCIDDAVADQFLRRALPADGTRCSFIDGVTDDRELADGLFGFVVDEAIDWTIDAIEYHGRTSADPLCVASSIVGDGPEVDDRVVSHLVLDVTSDVATVALQAAAARC